MAFDRLQFTSLSAQQSAGELAQAWQYQTEDPLGELAGTNYFADVHQSLHVNDLIRVLGMEGGNVVRRDELTVQGFLEEEPYDTAAIPAGNWAIERGWGPLWGENGEYPAVCGFHEGRLVLANFPRARTAFAFSIIGAPFDFATGDGSTAYGGARTVSNDQADAIYHVLSLSHLYLFCAHSEFVLDQSSGVDLHRAIIRHDSSRGSVRTIRPVEGEDGGAYFFQPNSVGISEFRYYYERGSHEAHSFTTLCGHLLRNPISATLWKGDANFETNILFFVNADGSMVCGTLKLAEKVMAFTRAETGRPFTAVCAVDRELFCASVDGSGATRLARFVRGSYLDRLGDPTPYESRITLLPPNSPGSPHFSDDTAVTSVSVYLTATAHLEINGAVAYSGPPRDGRIRHFPAGGWNGKALLALSDGSGTVPWQINNVGRALLIGGIFS